MTEKIFLGGGGNKEASKTIDDLFIENIQKRRLKKVIYIPIALTSKPYSECLKWFSSIFEGRVQNIEMWEDLKEKSLNKMENRFAVYFGGGNTVGLMNLINASGFDKEIKNFVASGGLIYGGSAGAIILGEDIRTAVEFAGSKLNQGLDLTGGYSISCHYGPIDSDRLTELRGHLDSDIIAIEENAGVIFDNSKIITVGPGSVYLFSRKERIKL